MKTYILSPHIDDAAFGLTCTISKLISNHVSVDLINCFTITKWTGVFVSKDIEVVSALRKQEDAAFNQYLGSAIKVTNLELLDAPLRNNYIHQFHPFNENELELIEQLKNHLLQQVDGLLFCPLALGNHIDHVLCLEAVIQVYPKIKVVFFEDLPYANRITLDEIKFHVDNLAKRLDAKLNSFISDLDQYTIDKNQAIHLYKSQVDEEICAEIIAHQNALNGERLWGEADNINLLKSLLN
ncbi:PIG-L family deacetylase [uncultured Mucilaginibacter sp.]|uniref:PIG-L deacetylase family protein n=1 Tax=uncultured Mucilaginibacter sp. TaxID=797541 RepID=UPI002613AA4B|nr:PIG-L family deacetylase [uncultured Mucilaginibacter sp.]